MVRPMSWATDICHLQSLWFYLRLRLLVVLIAHQPEPHQSSTELSTVILVEKFAGEFEFHKYFSSKSSAAKLETAKTTEVARLLV